MNTRSLQSDGVARGSSCDRSAQVDDLEIVKVQPQRSGLKRRRDKSGDKRPERFAGSPLCSSPARKFSPRLRLPPPASPATTSSFSVPSSPPLWKGWRDEDKTETVRSSELKCGVYTASVSALWSMHQAYFPPR